jgi:hypothetical protein
MRTATTVVVSVAICLCGSASPSAAGRLQGGRDNPLTSITRLQCRFTMKTSVLWKSGKPDARTEPADVRVTIADINLQDGTAEASGPDGRRFATAVLSDGSLLPFFTRPIAMAFAAVTIFTLLLYVKPFKAAVVRVRTAIGSGVRMLFARRA